MQVNGETIDFTNSLITEKNLIRDNIRLESIVEYINSDEEVVGYGIGGSESLVVFIKSHESDQPIVRKIWTEKIISAKWDINGVDTMTHPLIKAKLQIDYLSNLPDQAKTYFPHIYDFKYIPRNGALNDIICNMSMVPGIEVSSFIAKYQPSSNIVTKIYIEILKCLKENIHTHRKMRRTCKTLEISYFSKIIARLELAQLTLPCVFTHLVSSKYIWIDGEKLLNIPSLISEFRKMKISEILEPKYQSLVTGDTNTENIKITNLTPLFAAINDNNLNFDYSTLCIKFLDPRAIGFESSGSSTVDDYMYDNKPFHNSLGNYDAIHGEYFDIFVNSINEEPNIIVKYFKNHPFKHPYQNIKNDFKYIMEEGWDVDNPEFLKQDPFWLIRFVFLMGTHFSAMPPFHFQLQPNSQIIDEYAAQKRAVAIYCEGVKWLNIAYRMLKGEVREFYNIPIPDLKIRSF